ncbi:MAG: DNA methyltransferase [Termitinemataceae bacterium]|nr:MAG: DNA methyltransferase [Termitinemataceae bacterium]
MELAGIDTVGSAFFPSSLSDKHLLTIKEASLWATNHLKKKVSAANISYLIQYGRVKKISQNGTTFIPLMDLYNYYQSYNGSREVAFKERLGDGLNWDLSFDQYKEAETTKHVHRLHPYKGKFIPQLVEYFLDSHTDNFKKESYFNKDDIILDPFSGSGTTMVQCAELGMHAIGIDVSAFNALIGNSKVAYYDIIDIESKTKHITNLLQLFEANSNVHEFEEKLLQELSAFNNEYFPVPDYKYKLHNNEIDENAYGAEKEMQFLPTYNRLVKKYGIALRQEASNNFLDKWYSKHIRNEIDCVYTEIKKIKNIETRNVLCVILSRTIRSCRATTHADLATLLEPITATYYCSKHGKMCKPLFSILKWWKTYSKDTIQRILKFNSLRTRAYQFCITGDSRNVDIVGKIKKQSPEFGKLLEAKKINGIFSSPPYVGLIDYHEQHAYAYDLFGFERNDDKEIGPLFRGQGKEAKESYIQGISDVLNNCKKYFSKNYNVFLVANDKYNMYPTIAENAGMTIVNQFNRPVLNRTEKDKNAYSETIFHLKERK